MVKIQAHGRCDILHVRPPTVSTHHFDTPSDPCHYDHHPLLNCNLSELTWWHQVTDFPSPPLSLPCKAYMLLASEHPFPTKLWWWPSHPNMLYRTTTTTNYYFYFYYYYNYFFNFIFGRVGVSFFSPFPFSFFFLIFLFFLYNFLLSFTHRQRLQCSFQSTWWQSRSPRLFWVLPFNLLGWDAMAAHTGFHTLLLCTDFHVMSPKFCWIRFRHDVLGS